MLFRSHREIAEYDGTGALLRRYVYGPGIDEPVATVDAASAAAGEGWAAAALPVSAHGVRSVPL